MLLLLTFSVLVANPKELLYKVANRAPRGLLNREKKKIYRKYGSVGTSTCARVDTNICHV